MAKKRIEQEMFLKDYYTYGCERQTFSMTNLMETLEKIIADKKLEYNRNREWLEEFEEVDDTNRIVISDGLYSEIEEYTLEQLEVEISSLVTALDTLEMVQSLKRLFVFMRV